MFAKIDRGSNSGLLSRSFWKDGYTDPCLWKDIIEKIRYPWQQIDVVTNRLWSGLLVTSIYCDSRSPFENFVENWLTTVFIVQYKNEKSLPSENRIRLSQPRTRSYVWDQTHACWLPLRFARAPLLLHTAVQRRLKHYSCVESCCDYCNVLCILIELHCCGARTTRPGESCVGRRSSHQCTARSIRRRSCFF